VKPDGQNLHNCLMRFSGFRRLEALVTRRVVKGSNHRSAHVHVSLALSVLWTEVVGTTIHYSWYYHLLFRYTPDIVAIDDGTVLTPVPGESDLAGDLGLVDALAQLSFVVQGILGRIAAEHDLSIVQARLLGILRDRRPTIKDLAGFLQLDKSSVTGLVDRAEERGLVRRDPSPIDGRKVQVTITAAGRRLVNLATAAFGEEIADLVSDLTAGQLTRLSAAASRIVATDAYRRGIDVYDV
jgi:MarR family transcriptional regulator, lower aerobic nicotinate degradation pathway regulator